MAKIIERGSVPGKERHWPYGIILICPRCGCKFETAKEDDIKYQDMAIGSSVNAVTKCAEPDCKQVIIYTNPDIMKGIVNHAIHYESKNRLDYQE